MINYNIIEIFWQNSYNFEDFLTLDVIEKFIFFTKHNLFISLFMSKSVDASHTSALIRIHIISLALNAIISS